MTNKKTCLIGLGIFAIAFILRLPSLWIPILDVDEAQFAGFANALLAGGLPYVSSVDTKPLGIYWYFAAIFKLFGRNNMMAVHLVTTAWVALTGLYCAKIANTIYNKRSGIFAALFYVIFSTCYIPKFISTSIVVIMMLPLTMSIWHLIRWEDKNKPISLWLSGIFFGIACLFKYQAGIIIWIVAVYFLLFRPLYLRNSFIPAKKRAFVVYLLGGTLVGGAFALYITSIGVWNEFVFFSLEGSAAYIEAGIGTTDFIKRLLLRGGSFAAATFLVWYFAIRECGSLVKHIFTNQKHTQNQCEKFLIFFWLGLSFIAVSTGGRFFGHYFIQLLPPLVILASTQADKFFVWLENSSSITKKHQRAYSLFLAALILPAFLAFGARVSATHIYKAFGEDHGELYRPIGEYVKANTNPDETIFVWGFATPIYFFADRDAASRFLWCDWLTGRVAGSSTARERYFETSKFVTKGSWKMLFSDFAKNQPTYIIDTSPGNYHDYGKYPLLDFPQLIEYLDKNYAFEKRIKGADFYRRIGN